MGHAIGTNRAWIRQAAAAVTALHHSEKRRLEAQHVLDYTRRYPVAADNPVVASIMSAYCQILRALDRQPVPQRRPRAET